MTQLSTGLRAIFDSSREDFRLRVTTLEAAVDAIAGGTLDDQLHVAAQDAAHKLAGSLGIFGLPRGSALALELERRLTGSRAPVASDAPDLLGLASALRQELDGAPGAPSPLDIRELVEATTEPYPAGVATVARTSARILVVDDDPAVRRVLALILSEAGYEVHDVGSAQQARHALANDPIDLLLSDVSMPGETGIALVRFALCEHPEIATLLISVHDDPSIAQVAIDYGAYGYLSKPVRRSEVLIGVMNALRRRDVEARERATRENLERLVALRTGALSDALERIEMADRQRRDLQAEAIHLWAQSAEQRDPGIGGHIRRVGHSCAVVGRAFGLHAESLGLASVLHDIGKLAIPDSILHKAGPLTAIERLTIETHAEIGHEMLRDSSSGLLELAAVIARTHHEKFDGSGYPRGLAGGDIPLAGRIAAVADVFDALTCDRVYRSAWSIESAIDWMTSERGRHFDPDVLDAFLASIDEIHAAKDLPTNA